MHMDQTKAGGAGINLDGAQAEDGDLILGRTGPCAS